VTLERRKDVDQVVGAGSGGGQIVAQGAGEVEVVAQPSVGGAAHSAELVDDKERSLLPPRLERPPPARASVNSLVGVVRLPKTLAESKLAGVVLAGRQSAVVDPTPDGVVADP